MKFWWGIKAAESPDASVDDALRKKYQRFQRLLALNNECLELLAGLQQDLQYILPEPGFIRERIRKLFEKAGDVASDLNYLCDDCHVGLFRNLEVQRAEVYQYLKAREEETPPRLSLRLSEIDRRSAHQVGNKAAALGEILNRLGLPVPEGFVLTTEAYRRFCGIPLWETIRNEIKDLEIGNVEELETSAGRLRNLVLASPLPAVVGEEIMKQAGMLRAGSLGLAVRSSAVGEGERGTFAGQFESYLNIPPDDLASAYRRVVASRFSARALSYRVTMGLLEVEVPMAVLFLPTLDARASGLMYSRNPKDPRRDEIWITGTVGLGLDISSGAAPADFFVLSRAGAHSLLEQRLFRKERIVAPRRGGGVLRRSHSDEACEEACLKEEELRQLAAWAIRLEEHLGAPQDIEWALDREGELWVLQSRPLAVVDSKREERQKARTKAVPKLTGGQVVYPGRTSGPAYVVDESHPLAKTPRGAIVFVVRPTPDIVEVMPRMSGLIAEKGNVTGHGAALLREFRIPAIFQMPGSAGIVATGQSVSLDAVQCRVYAGVLWPPQQKAPLGLFPSNQPEEDVISSRVLALHLLDPDSFGFRPGRCRSVHDVLRFCHEKAIDTMFSMNDRVRDQGLREAQKVVTSSPMELRVLDLGGGLSPQSRQSATITPDEIRSRPFQALWRGVRHPGVTWSRSATPSFGGFASVLAGALSEQPGVKRALGDTSYLLVAEEYMNLNARMAYHFSMVDACLSDIANHNYVSFRFAGGGAGRWRRNLRASFIQAVLQHYGYHVDKRGDLVNAWIKKAEAQELEDRLDILGRLMACAGQLDMYMNSQETSRWFARQFIAGNYTFEPEH